MPFVWAASLILLLLLFGGDPNHANLRHLVLAGLSALVISVAIFHGALVRARALPWSLAAFVTLVIALPALQLVPLGEATVATLPGRDLALTTAHMVGVAPWTSFTLSPMSTVSVLIFLLPPLAMFLICLTLRKSDFFWLFAVVVAVAFVSIIVGLFQFSTGGNIFNFYNSAHKPFLVGFFANRNHEGIFLALSLALTIGMLLSSKAPRKTDYIVTLLIGFFVLAASIATNSRTGMVMCVASLVLAFVLLVRRGGLSRPVIFGTIGTAVVIAAGVAVFSNSVVDASAARFGDLSSDGRFEIWRASVDVLRYYFPYGTGLGSFVEVFNVHEKLVELTPQYVNHAHNDYIELIIEAGAAGILLLGLFLIWFATAAIRALKRRAEPGGELPLVGVFIVALFIGHSFVDYPLRTAALAGVMGIVAAYLAVMLWTLPDRGDSAAAG